MDAMTRAVEWRTNSLNNHAKQSPLLIPTCKHNHPHLLFIIQSNLQQLTTNNCLAGIRNLWPPLVDTFAQLDTSQLTHLEMGRSTNDLDKTRYTVCCSVIVCIQRRRSLQIVHIRVLVQVLLPGAMLPLTLRMVSES